MSSSNSVAPSAVIQEKLGADDTGRATVARSGAGARADAEESVARLKRDLEAYREVILPLYKVLEWEKNAYFGALVGAITFLFAIVWYLEPSVLTSFSLIGLIACLVDFVFPMISGYLFNAHEWTVSQERQFENICIHILNSTTHVHNLFTSLSQLKNDKPKAYLLLMMGAFAILSWIGSLIDNLLLIYLLIIFLVSLPGLRKHGILQKVSVRAGQAIKQLISGIKKKTGKSKTN